MSLKRLSRELNEFKQKTDATIPQDWNISLVNEDNMFEWKATFAGPDNTSYKYGIFEVNIKFPDNYPFKPPKVVFKSKMFHPNIIRKRLSAHYSSGVISKRIAYKT